MENSLFEYIDKIRMLGEHFARGGKLLMPYNVTICFGRAISIETGKMTLEEIQDWDILERTYYGEIGSIKRIIELINECDYEELKKEIAPIISKPIDLNKISENDEIAYKTIKNRLRQLFNKMVLQLCCGLKVIPTTKELIFLESSNLQENLSETMDNTLEAEDEIEKECEEDFEEEPEEFEDDMEYEAEDETDLEKEDNLRDETDLSQNVEEPYMIYSATQKKFYLMQEGKILMENIDVGLAMEITAGYLYRKEREKILTELQTGKVKKSNMQYTGIHIFKNDDKGIDEK